MLEQYSGPNLAREEVLSQLEKIKKLGWEVYIYQSPDNYIIKVDEDMEIFVKFSEKKWQVSSFIDGRCKYIKLASSFDNFIRLLNEAAAKIGVDLNIEQPKKSIRVKINKPLSNMIELIKLVGERKIQKIYDPYFDSRAVANLLSLNQLGLQFANPLLCLVREENKNKNNVDVTNAFTNETGIQIKIKIITSIKPHRRFLILENNAVIIPNFSLNDINKNEVITEETIKENCIQDLNFFDNEWSKAEDFI